MRFQSSLLLPSLILTSIACTLGPASIRSAEHNRWHLELIGVDKIGDSAPHNAFTDLIRYKGRWVCAFREAPAHAGGVKDSRVRVLVSDDAVQWKSAAALEDPRGDIRDAKLGITPEGDLVLLTATQFFDTSEQKHQSLVWHTSDLENWRGPRDVGDPDIWAWGIQFHKGIGYSIGYRTVTPRYVRLYTTRDGLTFETRVEDLGVDNSYPNESCLVFDRNDDTAYCLLRCSGPAQLGTAKPPYKDWTWRTLGVPVGGPEMIQLPDGRLLGAGRIYKPKAHTALFWIDPENASLTKTLELPSSGDTSYPGMVLHDGILHCSYYSSHEGKTSVYLAKIRIGGAGAPRADAIDIDNRLEPFVDDYLIDRIDGEARLRLNPPVNRGVVIRHDEPWEGNTSTYHTVFQDGDRYRMYYRGHHAATYGTGKIKNHPQFVCYAESPDGIHWTKPDLGLFEFNGSKDNNIVLASGPGTHNFAPFKDANPDAKPGEKYKAVGGDRHGLHAFVSPDGIHWKKMSDERVITDGAFDSLNLAFYDTHRGRYVDFHRHFHRGVRAIKTAHSSDFIHWSQPEWVEYTGAPDEHLYTNGTVAYHRAPHLFIALPKRFVPDRNPTGHPAKGVSDAVFMTSRDGKTFHRWPEALIRPGLQQSRWVNRNNLAAWGIVETESDVPGTPNELSIYTTEDYYTGDAAALRRHTWRLDGFVSLHGSYRGGEVVTKPLVFSPVRRSPAKTARPAPARPIPTSVAPTRDGGLAGGGAIEFRTATILEIPGTKNLGKHVTLAAQVRAVPSQRRRLFSTYNGGSTAPGELFIDFDSDGDAVEGAAIRFGYNGMMVTAPAAKVGNWSRDTSFHHIAAVWNDGEVTLYFDGQPVGAGGSSGAGDLSFELGDLRFGEDHPPTSLTNEPFLGFVDDILVLKQALSAREIARLAREGARAAIDLDQSAGVLYAMENPDRPVADQLAGDGRQDGRFVSFADTTTVERGDLELFLNFATSAVGSVRVELQDENGTPIPGYSLSDCHVVFGDQIAQPVAWNGRTELSQLAGRPVRVRFALRDADIYAMRFGAEND